MKVRIVEYRIDLHQNFGNPTSFKPGTSISLTDKADPTTYFDPEIADGWTSLYAAEKPIKVRSRMFYGVTSIEQTEPDIAPDEELPGDAFELEFENDETLVVSQTVIAETEAEISVSA